MLSSLEILFLSSHSTFSNIPCVRSPININQQGSIEDIIYKPEIHSLCHLIFSVFWGIADPGSCWPCPNSHSHPESYVHLTPSLTYVQWRKDWYAFVTALWWCGVLCSLHLKQSVVRRRCLMQCRTLIWQLWLLCYGCYGWKQVWKAFLSYVGITGLWHSCTQQQGRAPLMLHQCCFLYAPLVIRTTMSLLSAVSTYGSILKLGPSCSWENIHLKGLVSSLWISFPHTDIFQELPVDRAAVCKNLMLQKSTQSCFVPVVTDM